MRPAAVSRERSAGHPMHRGWVPASRLVVLLLLVLAAAGCSAPVLVEWSTETEMNTAGFNLLRSESPDGPFDVKVNDQLIPPSPDPMTGGQYRYTDRTARLGVTYYYQLQEVEQNGTANVVGTISVRAGSFAWWQGVILVALAAGVILLWVFGGPRATRTREKIPQ